MTSPTKQKRSYSLGAVMPHTRRCAELVGNLFDVESILGWRASAIDKMGHPAGLALDFMCGKQQGDRINAYLLANAGSLGVKYTIWQQTYFEPGKPPSRMEDRGSPTQNHEDHVHASMKATGGDGSPVSADFAGVGTSGTAEIDGGPFADWSGGLLSIGIKLTATGAALALVVSGVRKTVKS